MHTLYTQSLCLLALPAATLDSDATVDGETIDLAVFKNNFRTVMFVATAAEITDGTHAFAVEHSYDGVDWAAVPSGRVQGELPVFDDGASDSVAAFGYIVATQRYVRVTVTTADATEGGVVSAAAVLAGASTSPPARS